MKFTKIILASVYATSVVIPTLISNTAIASASVIKKSYTQADINYLNYNGHYFTVEEQLSYKAKDWYFHHYDGTTVSLGVADSEWWKNMKTYRYNWAVSTSNGNAYRPIDVPAKFALAQKYFKLAKLAMDNEQKTFDKIFWYVATKNETAKNSAVKELAKYEQDYAKYKNLYLQEYINLHKMYKK